MENVIIQASAGTGKTHQLACRYLLLLFSGDGQNIVRPENILATTFTKKAAGEILNRILSWLANGAYDENGFKELLKNLNASKTLTQQGDTSPVELTLDIVREKLKDVIKNLNRVNVSTLDSYFNQRAQCFSLELELPMDWQIMEDAQDKMFRQTALSEIFQDKDTVRRYTQFIKDSKLKRSAFEQMMTSIENLYSLWKEAPDEAWDALKTVKKKFNYDAFQELVSQTIDCLGQYVDSEEDEAVQEGSGAKKPKKKDIDYFKSFLSQEDAIFDSFLDFFKHAIGKKCLSLVKSPSDGIRISKADITDPITIDNLIKLTKIAEAYVRYVWKKQSDFYRTTLKQFHDEYWSCKKESGMLRFEDIPWLLTQESFVERQLSDSFRMDSSIRHLMLDEFQDTSLAQWQVLESLARKTVEDKNGSFFCVGDSKQAIYSWRGGEAQLLQEMTNLLSSEDAPADIHTIQMTESRRSGKWIMQAVNDLFNNLSDNPLVVKTSARMNEPQPMLEAIEEWKGNRFSEHKSHEKCADLPSYVELRTAPYSGDAAKEDKNNTEKLRLMTYKFTAQRIKELYEQTEALGLSIGVLVNKNIDGATIADCIKQLGLECSLEGNSPLLDSYEVCQILAIMKWIDHPGDVYSYYLVSQSPLAKEFGIKDRWKTSRDDRQRMKVPFEDCEILNRIRNELFRDGYGLTVQRWVEKLKPEANALSRRRLEMLEELANNYDPQGSTRTDDFITYIENASLEDSFKARIRIMTFHKSKGLEFDIVILPQLDVQLVVYDSIPVVYGRPNPIEAPNEIVRYVNGDYRHLLPLNLQRLFPISEKIQMSESLCVIYVAMTRARQGLYMILPPPKTGILGTGKTYEDVLLGTLGKVTNKKNKEENKVYYSVGDPDWIRNTELKRKSEKKADKKTLVETTEVSGFTLNDDRRSDCVFLPATSWTTNKPLDCVKVVTAEVDILKSSGSSLSQNLRGTLFHRWLADIEWLEEYRVDDQKLIDQGVEIGLQQKSFIKLMPSFKALLEHPNVISTLKRPAGTWKAYREKNVAGILEDKENKYLVSGVIDRLLLHRAADGKVDKAIIIDYKTVQKGSNIAEVHARYAGQMDAYRQIVSRMYCIPEKEVDKVVETTLLILEGDF